MPTWYSKAQTDTLLNGKATLAGVASTYLTLGTEFRMSYWNKADGASTTVADSGQTIRMKTNGTGAAVRIAGGALINDGTTGVCANYATVNMGATVNRIGGKFYFRGGGAANPTGNFGSFTTPIWTQDITDAFPNVPPARCHPFVGKYFCSFQIYENGHGVPLVPTGYSSSTLYYDAPLVDDGVTIYEIEVIFPTNDTAVMRAPDGRVYTFKDSRIASYAAAGQWACFEHYQSSAATDTGVGIVEIWASTAPQAPWRHNSLEGPARSIAELQKRIPWAKRETRSIQRTDAGAGTTNGSPVVTDTTITAADLGRPVSGTGIPNSSYIGTVTAGASFRLSSSATSQVDVNATATGTVSLNVGTVSMALTTTLADVDYGSMQITAPSIPASGVLAFDVAVWVDMHTTATAVILGLRKSTGTNLLVERVLDLTPYAGIVRARILVTNLSPTTSPTTFILQANATAAGAATIKIGSGGYVGHLAVEPILDGATVAAAGTTPALTATDNGDGTFGATGTSVTDNGDGTFTTTDSAATDNGDGTFTLAA